MNPLELLNEILAKNVPGETVKISPVDAKSLESLGQHSLGDLWPVVKKEGIGPALERHGLFGRNIRIVKSEPDR